MVHKLHQLTSSSRKAMKQKSFAQNSFHNNQPWNGRLCNEFASNLGQATLLTESEGDVRSTLSYGSQQVEQEAVDGRCRKVTAGIVTLLVLPFIELPEVPVAGVEGQGVAGVGGKRDQPFVHVRVCPVQRIATLLETKRFNTIRNDDLLSVPWSETPSTSWRIEDGNCRGMSW